MRARPAGIRRLAELGRSVGVGLLAGGLYAVLRVDDPAPPWVALVGLGGILLGEHAVRRGLDRGRSRGRGRGQDPDPSRG